MLDSKIEMSVKVIKHKVQIFIESLKTIELSNADQKGSRLVIIDANSRFSFVNKYLSAEAVNQNFLTKFNQSLVT